MAAIKYILLSIDAYYAMCYNVFMNIQTEDRKSKMTMIRMTETEKTAIIELARRVGLSVSRYMVLKSMDALSKR